MEGKAPRGRDGDDDQDPLALTLGSIYAAADPRDADAAVDAGVQRPPFPWATERPAQHDTLEGLLRRGVTSVEGQARCKRCSDRKTVWMYPALPDCDKCGNKGAMWPEIAAEKREINWLFLLLGQMLGCCTLEQLKYFCKKTGRHRTGAKNRVLYYAYIEMCNQLEPLD
ncbi:uncharacterized protein LOC101768302 [Setaria italica]|uniref:uncharacterized protein LOC101768302 n=1 Tax=Setaria italica TaxID=4555 RepID=UPI000BE4B214|nr:uncharacterized protein LOC101768302 [Setaria italica]